MGDKDQTTTSGTSDQGSGTGVRRASSRRPFWRRGWFWLAVIGVEVALALAVSFSFERDATSVDLAGADLPSFCATATAFRERGVGSSRAGDEGTAVDDPSRFVAERDAYRSLIATAPADLVHDLETLAEASDRLAATAEDIGRRKAEDPTYSGLEPLDQALREVGADTKVEAARVSLVLREQCGIGPGSGGSTTTPAPSVVGPVTTGP